jgi:gamma-glutamylcyclotransferase (GGCT)/AIG2-like uncharacterized protein YtfP
MVPDTEHGSEIPGELWIVDAETLERLDEFECVPNLFIRTNVELSCGSAAQAYFYAGSRLPRR